MCRIIVAAVVAVLALAACSSSSKSSSGQTSSPQTQLATAATTTSPRLLRILVTNDDGVTAPGIDALVQALRTVPNAEVTVVAPADNNSGTGGKVTNGTLTVTDAKTLSGYPAKAVHGYPADTIVWAVDQHGVAEKPDVVVSGVNFGQNLGPVIDLSGTVGAARAAAQRGIPALAVSAGLAAKPNYAGGANAAVQWVEKERAAFPEGSVTNINVPTCPSGTLRPVVVVPLAPKSSPGITAVNCEGSAPKPANDVDGFAHGYIVQTNDVPLKPAA